MPKEAARAGLAVREMLLEMRQALEDEIGRIRAEDSATIRRAHHGKYKGLLGAQHRYTFTLDDEWTIADDTPLTLKGSRNHSITATLLSMEGMSVTIATDVALSAEDQIQIKLINDVSQLYEKLRDLLAHPPNDTGKIAAKAFGAREFSTA